MSLRAWWGGLSSIDGCTNYHNSDAISQRIRKRIEDPFGWIKTTAGLRKARHRGLGCFGWSSH